MNNFYNTIIPGLGKGTVYSTGGRALTLEDVERANNSILYSQYLTDKEMLIDQLKQTPVGKILYG